MRKFSQGRPGQLPGLGVWLARGVAVRTKEPKSSAEAMVSFSPLTLTSTPVRMGLASSLEAAKATCWMISFRSAH
jgi:hypothetical protein